jgi:hypothetical protein
MPSSRFETNRRRHKATVSGWIPSVAAIAWLVQPSAAIKTILARRALFTGWSDA